EVGGGPGGPGAAVEVRRGPGGPGGRAERSAAVRSTAAAADRPGAADDRTVVGGPFGRLGGGARGPGGPGRLALLQLQGQLNDFGAADDRTVADGAGACGAIEAVEDGDYTARLGAAGAVPGRGTERGKKPLALEG